MKRKGSSLSNPRRPKLRRQGAYGNLAQYIAPRPYRRRRHIGLGTEVKFYDKSLVANALIAPSDASSGEHDPSATTTLNTVVQGDGESNRDGKQIRMLSIQVKGRITCAAQAAASTADNSTKVVVYVVLDTQTNGATIVSENVFTNPSANAAGAADVFRNLAYSKRYRVLAKEVMTLAPMTLAGSPTTGDVVQGGVEGSFDIFKPLNLITNFSGTTENVSNIVDNSIHVIAYATSTALAPLITYNSRLRFVG